MDYVLLSVVRVVGLKLFPCCARTVAHGQLRKNGLSVISDICDWSFVSYHLASYTCQLSAALSPVTHLSFINYMHHFQSYVCHGNRSVVHHI